MNVYDFDKTVYDGDSTVNFWKYCLEMYPETRSSLPEQGFFGLCYLLHIIDKTKFKEHFFSFLKYVPDLENVIKDFWDIEQHAIKKWYLKDRRDDDLIISASPDFLLRPICQQMKVRLLASRIDPQTRKYKGVNCHGKEKVRRYRESYGKTPIENFYSDSRVDTPMAEIAEQAFLVDGYIRDPWKKNGADVRRVRGKKKVKRT